MKLLIIYLKIIYLFFFLLMKVYAEETIPIDITADEMQWDDNKRIAYAIGNAVAVQGNKTITATKLIVYLEKNKDNNEIILIKAEGNVVFTTIDEIATGKIATYDLVKNNIVIENNVTLKKNDSIMKGEILEMDFNTGISQINSIKNSKKVKMRFLPKKSDKK